MTEQRTGMDGSTAARLLERGLDAVQVFPDYAISRITASHVFNLSLRVDVAPYAVRPDVMRVLLLSAFDGRPTIGSPADSGFLLYNLRLSNNVAAADGLHVHIGEVTEPGKPYNTHMKPFPPKKRRLPATQAN
jgi:hypothetical protein